MIRDKEEIGVGERRNKGRRANSKRNKVGRRQMEDRSGIKKERGWGKFRRG